MFIQRSVKLSQAFVSAGPEGRVHTRCRSQTSHPQGSDFQLSLLFSVLNTGGGRRTSPGKTAQKFNFF